MMIIILIPVTSTVVFTKHDPKTKTITLSSTTTTITLQTTTWTPSTTTTSTTKSKYIVSEWLLPKIYLVPGVIVTGGRPSPVGVSVEVFNPHTKHSCSLTHLPGHEIFLHSQCGRMICGGISFSNQQSCLKLNPLTGAFTPTYGKLVEKRYNHLCWDVEGEGGPTLLIGGQFSPRSTELVSSDGLSSSASFTLQYDTT